DVEGGQNVGPQQGGQVQLGGIEADWIGGRHARVPAERVQVVGHGADGVGRAVHQIDLAGAVEIHAEPGPVGRHELRHAHGTRVAAQRHERVGAGAAGEQKDLCKLAFEV